MAVNVSVSVVITRVEDKGFEARWERKNRSGVAGLGGERHVVGSEFNTLFFF